MSGPLFEDDPRRVGAFELVGRLGEGGQGAVFLGRDAQGREVAVKLLHARVNEEARRRFVRELEVAERVSGFCTARVLDADVEGDQPYIVSEYVPGPSLTEVVGDEGPLDAGALMRLAIGTATALVAIHRAGIVHRDFKPPNVLIGPGGPRVIDFGIARALDSSTVTSQVVGTPAYMAPEQVAGGAIGPAADVFAWGCVMVFAATGRSPFGGDSIPAVMHRVLHAEVDVSALPAPLAWLAGACLAKDPARRPSSSEVLYRLLGQVGAEPPAGVDPVERGAAVMTGGPPAVVPHRLSPTRKRLLLVGLPVGLVLLVAILITIPRIIAVLLLSSGNGDGGGGGGGGASATGTVRVALMAPLNGTFDELPNARLAVDEHNATNPRTRVQLVQIASSAEPGQAPSVARSAVARGPVAVVGPTYGHEIALGVPILNEAKIPVVSPSAVGPAVSSQDWKYWHTMVPIADEAVGALAVLAGRDAKAARFAVVDDGQEDAGYAANVFATRVQAPPQDKEVVRVTVKLPVAGPLESEVTAAARKIVASRADAVFFGGIFDTTARVVKATRAMGFKGRFYLTNGSFTETFVELAGRGPAEGTVIACSCLSAPAGATGTPLGYSGYLARFKAANGGRTPARFGPETYDAMTAVLTAIKAGRTTGEEINAYLRDIDTPGVTQRIRFREQGQLTDSVTYAYQVRGGAFTFLGNSSTASIR
ncbi:bifunctional serine/threonine-protein kinase/ABC transporter substrate-binding protein [Spirillospora sp. NPDC047279]|uniref:bifunctional serine/threonine-protein kinase/ABC transporter substrate-binding protein n=1 Tax=Spirillospora sp. NPDC047279 TaxID=3155478 RepID=UPI0034067F8E